MALYCFGDSFTEGYRNDMNFPPYQKYLSWLGLTDPIDMPPLWSELLGEKLNTKSYNFGKGGSSNHETLLKFSEKCHLIGDGDIVIINWTLVTRCLWNIHPNEYDEYSNKLESITPIHAEYYDSENRWKTAYELIAINRTDFSWTFEILGYQSIIDELAKAKNFKVYYWFTDDDLFRNLKQVENVNQEKYIINDLISEYDDYDDGKEFRYCCIPFDIMKEYGAKNIYDDSNETAPDKMHLGGTGHKIQSEIFYSYLTKTPYPKKLQKYL